MSYKLVDAQGNSFDAVDNSFEFVQKDKKIYDQAIGGKPTTFAKDALKRFAKNKSSVVGACVIGVLVVLSIVVPLFSKYDVVNTNAGEQYLPPKLFKAGTGFWDGCKDLTDLVDDETDKIVTYNNDAILKVNSDYYVASDVTSSYGKGGIFVFTNDNELTTEENPLDKCDTLVNYATFTINTSNAYQLDVSTTADISDYYYGLGYTAEPYMISLSYYDDSSKSNTVKKVTVQDWSTEYGEFNYNLSTLVSNNGDSVAYYCTVEVSVQSMVRTVYDNGMGFVGINYLKLSTDSTNASTVELLDEISITDANATAMVTNISGTTKFPNTFWRCSGRKNVSKVSLHYRSFNYDYYKAYYGTKSVVIGQSRMQDYIDSGYCKYNFKTGPSSFEKLSDECPIDTVVSSKYVNTPGLDAYYNLTCDVTYYKYLGYDKMPSFLFGTDSSGADIWTLCFKGFGISLLMAIGIFVINFTIGIVWGSVSGYYGGIVDLIMERITEILSGMPFICILTLLMLKFGRTIGVFMIAECMTGWIGNAGLARTQFYRFRGREYVLASRTLGATDSRLIFKHILPNGLGTIITSCVLDIPYVILGEASMSFYGLGIQTIKTFGVVLSENESNISSHPALILFPCVIVSLMMISFNLFGNGLRDALNPSLKGSE